jgi:hypothetical protein
MLDESIAWITALGAHVAEQAQLPALALGDRHLAAAEQDVGWMPMERSSFTECWVGLVFISPAVLM